MKATLQESFGFPCLRLSAAILEWAWNFKAYISMFETGAVTLMDRAELRAEEFLDEHLQMTLDTGDVDAEQTANRVLFSRKLHYLLSQLVKDSVKLIVRQNEDSNGFETWRRLYQKFSLPGATRSTSLLTQLLDFKFNPATVEQDFNVWETIKTRYERQSGQPLPDGVLVATLLNKTTGALQQHLRLNARTLQTYAQVREVILEYHRSRLLMNPVAQTSANATFAGGASAPMDIGALAAALWKGKGKGKGKKGKGQGRKGKGKGKGKGKDFSKSSGKGGQHWNFMMKGKGKGKEKEENQLLALLRFAGRVVRQDTLQTTARTTVFQLLKEKNFTRRRTQEIGLTLVRTIGQSGPIGRSTR